MVKYCTNATTETYLELQVSINASPGPIPIVRQSAMMKEWKNIIVH